MENTQEIRSLLLHETAELAFNEIKRFLEPRLTDDFNLRRVSAPLFLPADSDLAGPGMHVTFPAYGSGEQMAVVTGLDLWLRSQLQRYDSAPGFGVFTVMNALRPDITETAVTSPHVTSWAWQQALDDNHADDRRLLTSAARSIHSLLRDTEKMLLAMFPHLSAVIPAEIEVADKAQIEAANPSADTLRSVHLYMRRRPDKALLLVDDKPDDPARVLSGQLLVWNDMLRTTLGLADIAVFSPGPEADMESLGGNLWRDIVALHLLHQTHLLK